MNEPAPAASLGGEMLERRSREPGRKVPLLTQTGRPGWAAARRPIPHPDDTPALLGWWRALCGGRGLPSLTDFDLAAIAEAWPDAVLFRCGASGLLDGRRLAGAAPAAIDYSPMVSEWVLSRAGEAVRSAVPLHERRDFPAPGGVTALALAALPAAAPDGTVGHILCGLATRRPATPAD